MSVSDDDEAAVFHDGSGRRYEKLLVSSLDQPKVKKRRVVVDGLPPLLESPPPSPSKRYGYDVLYQPENAPYQVNGRWFVDLRCSDDEVRTFRSQKASKKRQVKSSRSRTRKRTLGAIGGRLDGWWLGSHRQPRLMLPTLQPPQAEADAGRVVSVTTDTLRVWTRPDLEQAAAIEPEGVTMLRVSASPRFLLRLVEFMEQRGERVEVLSLYGDPTACELRFFRRDTA